MKKFLCGAGREIITPAVGTALYGYRPDLFSTCVHDDLTVTALALGNEKERTLLITATLGDTNTELVKNIIKCVSEKTGVPFENIMFCSTHTHCAPNVSGVVGWGEINTEYLNNVLIPGCVKASQTAVNSMVYAEVGYASGDSKIGINRRQQAPNGDVYLGQNPWGSYDPIMTVMVFRNAETKEGILNLIHYGCHGTACGAGTEITRDWSGMMIDRVEKLTGVMTAFYNGAVGDVGPRLTNGKTVGNITYVEELGSYAAMDAMRIIGNVKNYSSAELTTKSGVATLPYQKYPSLESIREELSKIENPEKLINLDKLRYEFLKRTEKLILDGDTEIPEGMKINILTVTLGDTVFISYPFEFFSEISMRMRAYSGMQNTLCCSCANGYEGYLPTQDQLCRGGYEVGVFRYASKYNLADDTDQNLINATLSILKQI